MSLFEPEERLSDPDLAGVLEVVPHEGASEDPADRWLIWLRWVAVVGMGATTVFASALVEELNVVPLMSVLLVIGASNLLWYAAVSPSVRRLRKAGAKDAPGQPRRTVEIQLAVDDANKAVSHAEAIKKFAILPVDWTEEGGQITPSLKLKRAVVMQEFGADVEALYG